MEKYLINDRNIDLLFEAYRDYYKTKPFKAAVDLALKHMEIDRSIPRAVGERLFKLGVKKHKLVF